MKVKGLIAAGALALLSVPLFGAVQAQDSVNLVLWHAKQDAEGDALLSLIDAFEAANPGITIEQVYNPSNTIQDSFRAAAGAGEGPDMIVWANDAVGDWANNSLVQPITDIVTDDLRANASDTAWGLFTYNDDVWGIPYSAKTLAFFYNRALVPEAPATWQDVLDTAQQLHEEDSSITGLAFQNGFFHSAGFLYSLDGSLMDTDGNANFAPDTDGATAMDAYLQFHQDIYNLAQDPDSGVVVDGASPNPGFQQGTVAMVYDGVWNLAQFESDLGDDLGVSVMPALDNGNVPALFAQGEGFFVSSATDASKMDAIAAWAAFVTGVEGQTIAAEEGGLLPVNPAVPLEDPNLVTFGEQFALGTPFPNRPELSAFWGPMGDAIAAVSGNGETPADARAAAYDAIQESIDGIHDAATASS